MCDLHLQPCRSNAGCMWNCDMLDVIRAWLEFLMGRVSESGVEADFRMHYRQKSDGFFADSHFQ